jgi:hypothetical protein
LIDNELFRWAMTAALSAATVYCAFRAGGRSPIPLRVNYGLHGLMTTAMTGMLLHGRDWPLLPQVLVFGLAAWWFAVQAASPQAKQGKPQQRQGRGKCLYDALSMTAMAYMLAAAQFAGTEKASGSPEPAALVVQGPHHAAEMAARPATLAAAHDWTSQATVVLAVVFAAACLLWAARLVDSLGAGALPPSALQKRRRMLRLADLGNELVSASAMAVMFAVLAT